MPNGFSRTIDAPKNPFGVFAFHDDDGPVPLPQACMGNIIRAVFGSKKFQQGLTAELKKVGLSLEEMN